MAVVGAVEDPLFELGLRGMVGGGGELERVQGGEVELCERDGCLLRGAARGELDYAAHVCGVGEHGRDPGIEPGFGDRARVSGAARRARVRRPARAGARAGW